MRRIVLAPFLCSVVIFLLPSYSLSDSCRCPNGEVVTGESTYTDVLSKCGTPFFVDRKMRGADVIDELAYKIEGGKIDTASRRGRTSEVTFTLVNGKLVKIGRDLRGD